MPLAVCIDPTKMSTNRNGDTSHRLHLSVSKTERGLKPLGVSCPQFATEHNSSLEALKTSGHVGHVVKTNGLVTVSLKVGVSPIPMDFSLFHHVPFLFHSHVGVQKPYPQDLTDLRWAASRHRDLGREMGQVIRV